MSEDEQRLRDIAAEVAAIMKKHDVGGAIFLTSEEAGAWQFVIPNWTSITSEGGGIYRVRIPVKTDLKRAISSMHFLTTICNMTAHCSELFGRIFESAREQVEGTGGEVTTGPFPGFKPPESN